MKEIHIKGQNRPISHTGTCIFEMKMARKIPAMDVSMYICTYPYKETMHCFKVFVYTHPGWLFSTLLKQCGDYGHVVGVFGVRQLVVNGVSQDHANVFWVLLQQLSENQSQQKGIGQYLLMYMFYVYYKTCLRWQLFLQMLGFAIKVIYWYILVQIFIVFLAWSRKLHLYILWSCLHLYQLGIILKFCLK